MDRISILEQLNLGNLLPNPYLWPSVKALFDWFGSHYRTIYQTHHRDYHREVVALRLLLDNAKPEIDALRRVNSIAELGSPVGEELFGQYDELLAKAKPCPTTGEVSDQPICPSCHLPLTTEPLTEEVKHFLDRLHHALKQQHRRLSGEAIRQILTQSKESRINQFIKVIQTSDLSSLVNVMDNELVDFLRGLLAEAHTHTHPCPALTQLREEFPTLEEQQIDEAVSEFAKLLRNAMEKAKREHPGKNIRLSL